MIRSGNDPTSNTNGATLCPVVVSAVCGLRRRRCRTSSAADLRPPRIEYFEGEVRVDGEEAEFGQVLEVGALVQTGEGSYCEIEFGQRNVLSGISRRPFHGGACQWDLGRCVKERTSTIESLVESMKKYLPSQLFDAIVGGQHSDDISSHYRKKLTVFFSDIVHFTPTTESMEAEDLSDLLNSYLDSMANIALKWGGTIDKFIGDAVMIFFGDPEFTTDADHALRAVKMSMEMLAKMGDLRRQWANKGIEQPLHIRIGINTGYCTVGNFGSENRMDYTIIGGNVNIAQRLESAANPDTILISHDTYSFIKDQIECERVEQVSLKGISHDVKTYRVLREKDAKTNFDMVAINPQGIALKESLVDPSTLRPEERKELVRILTMALYYAKGAVRYIYDEHLKSWKLTKNKSPEIAEEVSSVGAESESVQ